MGRHSEYTQEIGNAICERLATGESLHSVCRDEGMPDRSTVLRWVARHEDFRDQYARAKESGVEALADDLIAIADDGTNDYMEELARNGQDVTGWRENGEAIQRAKLRVDTRKWILSKLAPKKYGDKLQLAGDGGGPLKIVASSKDEEL